MEEEKNLKLEKARREKGFTQSELAERVGITRLWVHHIEKKGLLPSLVIAKKIAEVLEVKVDDIF